MSEINYYNDSELQTESKLVLCIQDYDKSDNVKTCLFIGWDGETNDYFVRGKRNDVDNTISQYVPYAFHSESTHDLYDFIKVIMRKKGFKSVTLYNFNNISGYTDKELTYDFLESYTDENYIIYNCNYVKLKRSKIVTVLRLLKNVYNWEDVNYGNFDRENTDCSVFNYSEDDEIFNEK